MKNNYDEQIKKVITIHGEEFDGNETTSPDLELGADAHFYHAWLRPVKGSEEGTHGERLRLIHKKLTAYGSKGPEWIIVEHQRELPSTGNETRDGHQSVYRPWDQIYLSKDGKVLLNELNDKHKRIISSLEKKANATKDLQEAETILEQEL